MCSETKICKCCLFDKSLDDFGISNKNKDGKRTLCKKCRQIFGDKVGYEKIRDNIETGKILIEIPKTRICKECELEKNIEEFTTISDYKFGRNTKCKECINKRTKELTLEKKEKHNKIDLQNNFKICFCCKLNKCLLEFSKQSRNPLGVNYICKKCMSLKSKERREKLNAKPLPELPKDMKKQCSMCKEYKLASEEFYRSKMGKNGINPICKKCKRENDKFINERDPSHKEKRNNWHRNKLNTNPVYKVRSCVTRSINAALKNLGTGKKGQSAWPKLDYTPQMLKEHLESLFEPWMNWGNHGKFNPEKKTWQIDHILPQILFPYTSMDDINFKRCWNLKNLRPLEAIENYKKGDNILVDHEATNKLLEEYNMTNLIKNNQDTIINL